MAANETITRPTDRPGAEPAHEDSLGVLLRDLAEKSSRLIREEVALAKAEMREKAEHFTKNAKKMVIGGAILLAALLVLMVAVNRGLTMLMVQFMPMDIAVWLSPLILGGILALIGMGMLKGASSTIKEEGVTPTKSIESLRGEKDWIKHTVKEARNG
ncbi:MAG: phage holin family protein [Candidatus Krumholzibacteriia bacterium]